MDDARFDGLARLLAKAGSRRNAVRAALGLAAGAVTGLVATETSAKRRKGGPSAAGPCGSGKVKDNRCKRDSQCCTNICERNLKNKDKKGRCRCRNWGEACTEDRNCCVRRGQQMVCLDGICTSPTCTPPASCGVDGDCCPGQGCFETNCLTLCNADSCPNGCCIGPTMCFLHEAQPPSGGFCGTGGEACTVCAGDCVDGICTED